MKNNESLLTAAEIEISYRPSIASKPVIKSALDAYTYLRPFYTDATIFLQEQFVVAYLSRANRILGVYRASAGGITGTVADLRLILAIGLRTCATAIILSHNRPSASLIPSTADIDLTKRLNQAQAC